MNGFPWTATGSDRLGTRGSSAAFAPTGGSRCANEMELGKVGEGLLKTRPLEMGAAGFYNGTYGIHRERVENHAWRKCANHSSWFYGPEDGRAEDHYAHGLRLSDGGTGRCGGRGRHFGGRHFGDGRRGACQYLARDFGPNDLSCRDGRPGGAARLDGGRHAVSKLSPGRVQGHRERRPDLEGDALPGGEAGMRGGTGRSG